MSLLLQIHTKTAASVGLQTFTRTTKCVKNGRIVYTLCPGSFVAVHSFFCGNGTLEKPLQIEFNRLQTEVDKHKGYFEVIAGYTALRPHEYKAYMKMAALPFVSTICETGFNAGHSSFGWLSSNPHAHVYSFDIGEHGYSRPMYEYLNAQFPGRLTITWGDSTQTLPEFRRTHPEVKCDVMIVDGAHTREVCKADLENFRQMASADNIVILDDYPSPQWQNNLGPPWEEAKEAGQITELYSCNDQLDKATPWYRSIHGFSVGAYHVRSV